MTPPRLCHRERWMKHINSRASQKDREKKKTDPCFVRAWNAARGSQRRKQKKEKKKKRRKKQTLVLFAQGLELGLEGLVGLHVV